MRKCTARQRDLAGPGVTGAVCDIAIGGQCIAAVRKGGTAECQCPSDCHSPSERLRSRPRESEVSVTLRAVKDPDSLARAVVFNRACRTNAVRRVVRWERIGTSHLQRCTAGKGQCAASRGAVERVASKQKRACRNGQIAGNAFCACQCFCSQA